MNDYTTELEARDYELVRGFDSAVGLACETWNIGRPSLIVTRNYAVWRFNSRKVSVREKNENLLHVNESKKEYNGYLSKATTSKITKMLDGWLSALIKFKDKQVVKGLYSKRLPVFLTLTIPPISLLDHNFAKRELLMRFIDILKSKYKVVHYFWRAEIQKNGQIHFHLIVDHYIARFAIQYEWNKLLFNTLDYSEKYTFQSFIKSPSTHLKGISDVKNFISYVTKYCVKDDENGIVDGRIWGCSDALRGIKNFEIDYTPLVSRTFEKYVSKSKTRTKEGKGFMLYFNNNMLTHLTTSYVFKNEYVSYLRNILLDLYQEKTIRKEFIKSLIPPVLKPQQLEILFNLN